MEKIKRFFKEVVAELRKVTWPTKDELIGSTIVTIVVSSVLAVFIFGVDQLLNFGIRALLGGGLGG